MGLIVLNQKEKQLALKPSANRTKIIWVIIYSLLNTVRYSVKTIFIGLFSKNKDKIETRHKVNQVIFFWASGLVKKVGLDWTIDKNPEDQIPENRPVIFMCNHTSIYDIPLAYVAMPGTMRMIAKKELFKVPFLSQGMRAAEFISIDRTNREQAIKDLQVAQDNMESGMRIWMFPEGSRSADGELRPLKKGGIRLAIDTSAIIIPVVIQDIHHVLPNKKWLKMRIGQKVNIKVGEAIDCHSFDIEDRHDLAELVYNQMKQLLEEKSE